ncbi:MAG: beta-eliminating lyase-related protein, partial [Psychrilyobacter sp.]|uniref:beta-eliminating lyase-related protein n=1 Tax=Psychrilyobacter sp. TaxID=2586924 RepID=UPI003C784EB7
TNIDHLIGAIDEDVVALIYIKSHHCVQKGMLSIENMVDISKEYKLPLIIDAAAEEDLKKYINLGADLVIYSGAKAICAPASGFVTGKKKYIDSIKAQYKGIGRSMKVGKMAIAGLLQAIDEYANKNLELTIASQKDLSNLLISKLKNEKKVSSKMVQDEAGREIYRVQISLNKDLTNITGNDFLQKLKDGKVQIHVRKHYSNLGIINIDMRALTESDIDFIAQKIKNILKEEIINEY